MYVRIYIKSIYSRPNSIQIYKQFLKQNEAKWGEKSTSDINKFKNKTFFSKVIKIIEQKMGNTIQEYLSNKRIGKN